MHDAMLGDPGALSRLPPLLEAAGEARSIAACFAHATACETGFGSSAALDSLRDVLPRYQVIHLAAHALVDELDPGRSALVLARPTGDPADIDAGTAGGLLTAEDILLSWRIRADLVTLSGCRTGGGQGTQTGEFLGFTQALLGAGAAAVVESRWSVNDRPTALFMRRFYQTLTGATAEPGKNGRALSPPEALRDAQRWLRDFAGAGGEHPYRHPIYWAGFRLVGASP